MPIEPGVSEQLLLFVFCNVYANVTRINGLLTYLTTLL